MHKLNLIILPVCATIVIGCHERNVVRAEKSDFYERCREIVVEENKIGEAYFFKRGDDVIDEISIIYLGNIISHKGDTLRVLNSVNFTGFNESARRANANTFIYNSYRKKLGHYHIGYLYSLPTSINDGSLIFDYYEDCNIKTSVDLRDKIPNEIFIRCNSNEGDIYKFFD